MITIKFKRFVSIFLIFICILSVSSLADFTGVDSVNLDNVSRKCNSIEAYIVTYIPAIDSDLDSIRQYLQHMDATMNLWQQVNGWFGLIRSEITAENTKLQNTYDLLSNWGNSNGWLGLIAGRLNSPHGSVTELTYSIYDLLNADKEKQEDALDDYSSSGGRSASDTSSDVGSISGSLSNSFNSGVSASSALNAVDDNQSDFQYFFFGMTNDLNTSGGASGAPARGSKSIDYGSQVPDFLSDYWEGLNG